MSPYNTRPIPSSGVLEEGIVSAVPICIEEYKDTLDILRPENKKWLLSSNILIFKDDTFHRLFEELKTKIIPLKQKTEHLASQIQKLKQHSNKLKIKDGFSTVLIVGIGICAALAATELAYVGLKLAASQAIFLGGLVLCCIYPATEWRYRKTQKQLKALSLLQKKRVQLYDACFTKLQSELNRINTKIAKTIKKKLRYLEIQAEWAGEVKSEKQLFHSSSRFLQGKAAQYKSPGKAISYLAPIL